MSGVTGTSRRQSRRVLLVEDDGALRNTLAGYLRECDYTVDQTQNGLEALERLEQAVPDVTLLDLNMPQMDGVTFMETVGATHAGPSCHSSCFLEPPRTRSKPHAWVRVRT